MQIVVLCATDRGFSGLQSLHRLAPRARFIVCTFPETRHEPPYVQKIEDFCHKNGCLFFLQRDISQPPASAFILDNTDLLFGFSWRYLIPPEIYKSTRLGSFVIHDSLLPRYRGFSPLVWALINGERDVGVTLFEMAEAVDSGRIVGQTSIEVGDEDDIGTIRSKSTIATVGLLERHFASLANGRARFAIQDERLATYCCKWLPSDARIKWNLDRDSIYNLIRATAMPYTGAFCFRGNDKITVWKAKKPDHEREYESHIPGAVCQVGKDGAIGVLTGTGELVLLEVSLNGAPPQKAGEVLNSYSARLT